MLNVFLTDRFRRAVELAILCHEGQLRRATATPYISHPMTVASIVMEYGGTEDQIIAALLHDTMEDCGVKRESLEEQFGLAVARIVEECSDFVGPVKPGWRERKEAYLRHLAKASREALLVSAADKLHNARAMAHDLKHYGSAIWDRFHAAPDEIVWYYRMVLKALKERAEEFADSAEVSAKRFRILLAELEETIGAMDRLRPDQRVWLAS